MSGVKTNALDAVLLFLIIATVTLLPNIQFSESLPAIQLIEFLIPVLIIVIAFRINKVKWNKLYLILAAFFAVILISIIVNSRLKELRDYFEFYKLFKYLVIIVYTSTIQITSFKKYVAKPIFLTLVGVNLLHYFNLFNINEFLETYYGGMHMGMFGLDSLGEPGTKRMIGTLQNPNINATVFALFSLVFLPLKRVKLKGWLFFALALTMTFLCQSRTVFIALGFMLVLYPFLNPYYNTGKEKLNGFLLFLGCFALAYGASFLIGEAGYLASLGNKSVVQTNSVQGRFGIWKMLFEMIKQKPIVGHGPYKEFFYDNNLYAENEYILTTWRYGVLGLLVLLSHHVYLLVFGFKYRTKPFGFLLIWGILLVGITSLTNHPMINPSILVFLGVVVGLFMNELNSQSPLIKSE